MVAALEDVSRISFNVETLVTREGRNLGRARPDKDGYFTEFPMAVLGIPTRNQTYYKVPEFVNQITSPDAYVSRMLKEGNLFGEHGHPKIAGMSNQQALERLMTVDEERISHHFRRIGTGQTLESGGMMVVADFKPTGPGGKYVEDSLAEPLINTAFSLRSVCVDNLVGGLRHRTMRKLVTFDFVAVPGYEQASKRFMPNAAGLESIHVDLSFTRNEAMAVFSEVAMESFTDTEINDIFGTSKIYLRNQQITLIKGTGLTKASDGEIRSLYHDLVKNP